jgi:adenylate kinase family enzyme
MTTIIINITRAYYLLGALLVRLLNFTHLSCGDLLRKIQHENSRLGVARSHSECVSLMREEFQRSVKASLLDERICGFVIDGCRTVEQAESIEADLSVCGLVLSKVIHLSLNLYSSIVRITHRSVHPPSGRCYNLKTSPPQVF